MFQSIYLNFVVGNIKFIIYNNMKKTFISNMDKIIKKLLIKSSALYLNTFIGFSSFGRFHFKSGFLTGTTFWGYRGLEKLRVFEVFKILVLFYYLQ